DGEERKEKREGAWKAFHEEGLSKGCTAKLEVTRRTAVARILWHSDARFHGAGASSKRNPQGDPNARHPHYKVTPPKVGTRGGRFF
ncbi:MAG TPA: hypothetical protein VFD27_20350, partial [Chthoniobacteraceae bacterium]|nr:hypothetical protein [Chthoniobacteraceae bacterium]